MRLYLVQHGEAEPKDIHPDRPLSKQGWEDVERTGIFLKGRVSIVRILHSGKTRARQTAELLATSVAPSKLIETMSGLDPLDPVEPFAKQIQDWNADTLIVGHLPFMGKLVAKLIADAKKVDIVDYQPGSIVCLERRENGRWVISWMLLPELTS
jgi:phosphohistidine phosphatase